MKCDLMEDFNCCISIPLHKITEPPIGLAMNCSLAGQDKLQSSTRESSVNQENGALIVGAQLMIKGTSSSITTSVSTA